MDRCTGRRVITETMLKTAFLPFPKRQVLDSFKFKVFANDNFKHDANGGKFSERVENTVGNGEIARNEQFLYFLQCF